MPNTSKARVVFDASPLRYLYTGLGQFTFQLIKALSELQRHEFDISYLVHPESKHILKGIANKFITATPLKRHMPPFFFPALFGQYDLWHATTENTRFTHFSKSAKVLLTIHGLHFLDEDSPDAARRKLKHVQQMINRSDAIATVSKFTANLVHKHLDIGGRPMRVIPNGVEKNTLAILKRPAAVPDQKLLFSIGTFFERKNFHVLFPLLAQLKDYALVLAGNHATAYGEKIKSEIRRQGLSDRIILTGEVSEPEKYWLYKNCSAFVFPSISEGFGIPVIEAMQAGKPVFCSRYGSLPEIGGDLCFYWESFDPAHMEKYFLEKMNAFNIDPENQVRNKTYANGFSWSAAAQGYLSYYAELIK